MFMQFETPKGEKILVNMTMVSFISKKKNGTSVLVLGEWETYEVSESYEDIMERLARRSQVLDFGL